jgi:hypothetical protein
MLIDKIVENRVHHYEYTIHGQTYKGKLTVVEKVKKRNGWKVIGHDAKRNKTLTLYPVFITKLARQQ